MTNSIFDDWESKTIGKAWACVHGCRYMNVGACRCLDVGTKLFPFCFVICISCTFSLFLSHHTYAATICAYNHTCINSLYLYTNMRWDGETYTTIDTLSHTYTETFTYTFSSNHITLQQMRMTIPTCTYTEKQTKGIPTNIQTRAIHRLIVLGLLWSILFDSNLL